MISLSDKAFIDTSVMTDALLKQREAGVVARKAIAGFKETQLPVYAIKEFKAGPLRYYVWFYNKVLTTSSWGDAVESIRAIAATPQRNRLSTALQALAEFEHSIGSALPAEVAAKYPGNSRSEVTRAEAKIWLKTIILRAWRNRRKISTTVVAPLTCYRESDLRISPSGAIDDKPVVCSVRDCCMRQDFIKEPTALGNLLKACDDLPDKAETTKRRQALRQLVRTPKRELSEKDCRALGDAVFSFFCPADAVILTNNLVDHGPLAKAVNKQALKPV